MKLSVVVPAYNEAATVAALLSRVRALPIEKEIVVVDDGSTDGTAAILARERDVVVLRHERNRGKGAALRTGFARASGDAIVVQDADLEYFPEDLVPMFERVKEGAPIVFGSRNLALYRGMKTGRGAAPYFWGGRALGWVANALYGTRLTDEPTCYKMFRREVLDRVRLKCRRFEFCPEFVARASLAGFPIVEVPIRYAPRTRAEGKKIGFRDGLQALAVLVAIRLRLW